MVLCKFFQQGSCRFGTKCNNEHFDVKQIIKTDVEAAVNGKQWPFSCFGPFKDKPCIPNFIEDQSFEEMRLLCYESRQKNFFEQFNQQYAREMQEATNKMKALLQLTPDVVEVVTNVYDTPTADSTPAGGAIAENSNNPFGLAGAAAGEVASNPLFGKPAVAPAAGGSIFGGGNFGAANSAAVGGGSMFGNSAMAFANQQQQPQQQQQQQTSIFGAQQASKPLANSIFGGGAAQQQQQTNSIFGQQNLAAPVGGIFAQAAQQAQQQQQQQQPMSYGLFSQAATPAQQAAPGFGGFGQPPAAAQPMQAPNTGIFGQAAAQQTAANIFAAAQTAQAAPPQTQNIFAQAAQQLQQPAPPASNIFAQSLAPPVFDLSMQKQQQQQHTAPPAFMQQPASAVAGASTSLYSKMEDLTPDEIEAFKADSFQPGKIPFSPPPRELIN